MSGGLILPLAGIVHISFGCLGPGCFSLEHWGIKVPQPVWAASFGVWQLCWFFQVSRQLLLALVYTAFQAVTGHFPKSLAVPLPSPTGELRTVMSSPLSCLERQDTRASIHLGSFNLPKVCIWCENMELSLHIYGNLDLSVTLVLWGLCASERLIPRKKVFLIGIRYGSLWGLEGRQSWFFPLFLYLWDGQEHTWEGTQCGRGSLTAGVKP